jgi:outer membrane protein TolC
MANPRKRTKEEPKSVISAPQNVGDTTAASPDRARIAQRAYELYLLRGAADGAAMDDWLEAERELTQQEDTTVNR